MCTRLFYYRVVLCYITCTHSLTIDSANTKTESGVLDKKSKIMLFKSTEKSFYNHVRKIMSVSDINLLHLCNKKDVQLVSCKKYSKPNYLKNKTWL